MKVINRGYGFCTSFFAILFSKVMMLMYENKPTITVKTIPHPQPDKAIALLTRLTLKELNRIVEQQKSKKSSN
jgi:hypothetical protein